MLEEIDRRAMFQEVHRTIEESASTTAAQLVGGSCDLNYPPNCGLTTAEVRALQSLPKSSALESALRKVIADAAAYPMFHLFSLADGVVDPPKVTKLQKDEPHTPGLMLHDAFYESYWAWRRRRPDPGWRLDTHVDD